MFDKLFFVQVIVRVRYEAREERSIYDKNQSLLQL